MKKLFFFFFLASFFSPNPIVSFISFNQDFNEDLSFNDYNELLIDYAETSTYPDISK